MGVHTYKSFSNVHVIEQDVNNDLVSLGPAFEAGGVRDHVIKYGHDWPLGHVASFMDADRGGAFFGGLRVIQTWCQQLGIQV